MFKSITGPSVFKIPDVVDLRIISIYLEPIEDIILNKKATAIKKENEFKYSTYGFVYSIENGDIDVLNSLFTPQDFMFRASEEMLAIIHNRKNLLTSKYFDNVIDAMEVLDRHSKIRIPANANSKVKKDLHKLSMINRINCICLYFSAICVSKNKDIEPADFDFKFELIPNDEFFAKWLEQAKAALKALAEKTYIIDTDFIYSILRAEYISKINLFI